MPSRTPFTEQEWQTLKYAPLWVFSAVADADDYVDLNEIAAFVEEIEEGDLYQEPLVRDTFTALLQEDDLIARYKADKRDMSAGLAEVADILERKAKPSQAEAFKKVMLFIGRSVAEATGEDPFLAEKISGEEQISLSRVADILGISL